MSHSEHTNWVDMGEFMFHEQKLIEANMEAEQAIKLLGLNSGAHILDLPCGVGRHAIYLAKHGFKVTGVDITSDFLVQARLRADAENAYVRLLQADMRTFNDGGNLFDAIINLYTSFGYFEHKSDDLIVLRNFYSLLKPRGKLLMDLMSRELFLQRFPGRVQKELSDGSIESFDHVMKSDGWVQCKWARQKGALLHTARSGIRLYSSDELQSMLLQVGFSDVSVFGGLDGRTYDANSHHLVIIAGR